ncbi:MAG: M23 family metallopeptidase [Bacteroidetes bacterium]|nr:M23 family metallopeptidase [Bacteroidota bacterium]
MKKIVLLCSMWPMMAYSQKTAKPAYPQNYFRNPLDIPILLAGNFGECRPGHFHSGTDIKTNGRENLPVHAAAEGYISRIKTEPGGFGHALYVTHPNGYTTLYAHLNHFVAPVQAYLRKKQYEKQQWNLDIELTPDQFPVKKGEQIAWSGNTGASTAPHLHFEIRNTNSEHPLNPELFGLPIQDNIAPVPTTVAIYDMNHSIYFQSPREYQLRKKGSNYVPMRDTLLTDYNSAGIGIQATDRMNGSANALTFYTASVYMDGELCSTVTLDDIGYDETRYVNAYADYSRHKQSGKWIQCLFELPGNQLDRIYTLNNMRGGLNLKDGAVHKVRIELTDDRQNKSNVAFYLRYNGAPQRDTTCNIFHWAEQNVFEHPNVKFKMDKDVLYDNFCFKFSSQPYGFGYSDKYAIGSANIPLHKSFDLYIKPRKPIPFDMSSKVVFVYVDGEHEEGTAAIDAGEGWYKAAVRNLGTWYLAEDNQGPVITPQQKNGDNFAKAARLGFTIKDEITSVKKFKAEIDGNWVCLEQHGSNFFYEFDEHCGPGKHEMTITASDENDNQQTLQFTFNK